MQSVDLFSDVEIDDPIDGKVTALRLREVVHLRGCLGEQRDSFYIAAATNDDGACALHSLWGTISICDEESDWFSCPSPRLKLEQSLPSHVLEGPHTAMVMKMLRDCGRDLVRYCKTNAADCSETVLLWQCLDETVQAMFEDFVIGLGYESGQHTVLQHRLEAACRHTHSTNPTAHWDHGQEMWEHTHTHTQHAIVGHPERMSTTPPQGQG